MNRALRSFLIRYASKPAIGGRDGKRLTLGRCALSFVVGGCDGKRLMLQRRTPVSAKDMAPVKVMKKPSFVLTRYVLDVAITIAVDIPNAAKRTDALPACP